MVAAQEHSPRLTPEEYFTWEEQQEIKHEYFDGEVFAMLAPSVAEVSGGTINHGRISGRIFSLIDDRLNESIVASNFERVKFIIAIDRR